MTVLLGGLRVLGAHTTGSKHGVVTAKPGTLANDFFVNLLGMRTKWHRTGGDVYGAGTAKRTSSSGRAPAGRLDLRLSLAVACDRGGLRLRRFQE